MSKIKKIVEPKKFLKNQNIKKENKGDAIHIAIVLIVDVRNAITN